MPKVYGTIANRSSSYVYYPNTNSSSGSITDTMIDQGMMVKHYTYDYYPQADILVNYLNFYAEHEKLNIQYSRKVIYVDTFVPEEYNPDLIDDVPDEARFYITVSHKIARNNTKSNNSTITYDYIEENYACRYFILATGVRKLNIIPGNGYELADNYTTLNTNLTEYLGQRILIVGRGNGAMEVATHLQSVAGQIHMAGPGHRLRLAWETHYPGDIRQTHNRILESYQLKVLDGIIEIDTRQLNIRRDAQNPKKLWVTDNRGARALAVGKPPCAACPFRKPYDRVILCPGWIYDNEIFSDRIDIAPALSLAGGDKYPGIHAKYEALGTPGLFVIGTIAHSRDFKKTSGGFIHGFRYVIRAVHRILEEEELQERNKLKELKLFSPYSKNLLMTPIPKGWPRITLPHIRAIASAILNRANYAGGIFQMFGTLADVIILSPDCSFTHAVPDGAVVDPNDHNLDAIARDTPILGGVRSLPSPHLCGWLFEEVPIAAVPSLALKWATELGLVETDENINDALTTSKDKTTPKVKEPIERLNYFSYMTLTLEFGMNATVPGADPFRLTRAHVSPEYPEESNFLHPILRYYDSRIHVQHKRIETPGSMKDPWWKQAARRPLNPNPSSSSPPAAGPTGQAPPPGNEQPMPPKPENPYVVEMKMAANEVVDITEWTRVTPVPDDASPLLRRAAASAVGPRPAGFITPVTEFHIIEDFLNEYDIPARHSAALLRFLEHIGLNRVLFEELLVKEEEQIQLMKKSSSSSSSTTKQSSQHQYEGSQKLKVNKQDTIMILIDDLVHNNGTATSKELITAAQKVADSILLTWKRKKMTMERQMDNNKKSNSDDMSTFSPNSDENIMQRYADPYHLSPYAFLEGVQKYLPLFPLGYLTKQRIYSSYIPIETAARALGSIYAAADIQIVLAEEELVSKEVISDIDMDTENDDEDDDGMNIPDRDELIMFMQEEIAYHPDIIESLINIHHRYQAMFDSHHHGVSNDGMSLVSTTSGTMKSLTSVSAMTDTILSMMVEGAPVKLFKSDYEMKPYWYDSEDDDNEEEDAKQPIQYRVMAVAAGPAWHTQLPIPVRTGLLYNEPALRISVLLFHAGTRQKRKDEEKVDLLSKPDSDSSNMINSMLRRYASQYPQLPFFEVNMNSDDTISGIDMNPGDVIASSLGIKLSEIPCLIILVDTSKLQTRDALSKDSHFQTDNKNLKLSGISHVPRARNAMLGTMVNTNGQPISPEDHDNLELHTVTLAGKDGKYLDAALRARLVLAARRANVTVEGLPISSSTNSNSKSTNTMNNKGKGSSTNKIESDEELEAQIRSVTGFSLSNTDSNPSSSSSSMRTKESSSTNTWSRKSKDAHSEEKESMNVNSDGIAASLNMEGMDDNTWGIL